MFDINKPILFRNFVFFLFVLFNCIVLTNTVQVYVANYSSSNGILLPNNTLVGGDFVCFYVAGENAKNNIHHLYDFEASHKRQRQIVGDNPIEELYLPFAYPPLVAKLFSFFSWLPFQQAYFAWLMFSLLLASISLALILSHTSLSYPMMSLFFLCAITFVPFSVNCLAGGQTSCIGLLVFALIYHFLKNNQDFLAGAALALSYYKPPLFLIFLVFVLIQRRWRMLAGFATMAVVLISGSLHMLGFDGFLAYLKTASQYVYGQQLLQGVQLPPDQGIGLFALITRLFAHIPAAGNGFFALFSAMLVALSYFWGNGKTAREGKSKVFDLQFSLQAALSVMFSVQLLYYDLTLLLAPMILSAAWILRERIDKGYLLILMGIFGLYLEFFFRSSLSRFEPLKMAPVSLFLFYIGLLLVLRRMQKSHQRGYAQ